MHFFLKAGMRRNDCDPRLGLGMLYAAGAVILRRQRVQHKAVDSDKAMSSDDITITVKSKTTDSKPQCICVSTSTKR